MCSSDLGKGKGKGYGRRLIEECVKDARVQKLKGVAMLTSDRTWLAGKDIFESNGFVEAGSAPPSFHLMVLRFGSASAPSLPHNWEERARAFGRGLTVIRTPQCPYIENGARDILTFAKEKGIRARTVELNSVQEVQEQSPSAYGVFGTVLDGKLLAYQYLLQKDFDKLLLERNKGN